MEGKKKHLRCLLERDSRGVCVGYCLDFGVAAQGDSFEDVRSQLHEMIVSYLEEIEASIDAGRVAEAKALLTRRASWVVFAKYYCVRLKEFFHGSGGPPRHQRYHEDADLPPAAA